MWGLRTAPTSSEVYYSYWRSKWPGQVEQMAVDVPLSVIGGLHHELRYIPVEVETRGEFVDAGVAVGVDLELRPIPVGKWLCGMWVFRGVVFLEFVEG